MDNRKILICSDKFKGSLDAHGVCKAIAEGLISTYPDSIDIQPMADGGDGTLSVLKQKLKLSPTTTATIDPLGRAITAEYYIKDHHAYIELAAASGMWRLATEELNVMSTTTLGTGQLIAEAVTNECHTISLFLGGSCTNDVGLGILHRLGYQFISTSGKPLIPTGGNLLDIQQIVMPSSPVAFTMNILCDVTNPLYGPNGAGQIYGPQKGASPTQIEILDKGMEHIAKLIFSSTGKQVAEMPGAGATGGIGAGLVGLLPNAQMTNGFDYVSKAVSLKDKIIHSDIVISGEGKLDKSSLQGKVVGEVAKLCAQYGKPMIAIVGYTDLDENELRKQGISKSLSISSLSGSLNDSMTNAESYLKRLARQLFSTW